jgi:WhiB family transcriptional regulator, redox-sensing transcriptional regulator
MTRRDGARHYAAMAPALTVPRRWAERALCARAYPDAWFPDKGQRGLAAIAKRICRHCPVRALCLDYALSGADTGGGIATGIWGSSTPQERDQLRQQRKALVA